jgi:hypothetical protein
MTFPYGFQFRDCTSIIDAGLSSFVMVENVVICLNLHA